MKEKEMVAETDALPEGKKDEAIKDVMAAENMSAPEQAPATTPQQIGSYEIYAPEKITEKAKTGKVVLFFHASWCPSCQIVDKDIRANLAAIPSGVTILDVDYDTAQALRVKYKVTYQHTFVQVSPDGTQIKKWSGSPTLSAIIKEIQ